MINLFNLIVNNMDSTSSISIITIISFFFSGIFLANEIYKKIFPPVSSDTDSDTDSDDSSETIKP